jgi:hypothetical protein
LVLGMVMDGFSAILVAVPLVLPFAARFHLHPFHVAVMFLLNLELAFMLPPLGLNLFISSFRFNRPVVSLYRVVLPFAGLVALGLALIMYVPTISTALIASDIAAARAAAAKTHSPPREAWQLECVQEDTTHPLPCTPEEAALWGPAGTGPTPPSEPGTPAETATTPEASEDELFQQMLGGTPDAGAPPKTSPQPNLADDDELFRQMVGGTPEASAPKTPPPAMLTDDEIFRQMMGDAGAK